MDGGKKTPITWLELLKEKLNYLKKTTGKSVSVGEVAGEAKKEWVQIKEGKHPKYMQGTQQGKNKQSKQSKQNKQSKQTKKMHHHSLNKTNTHMQEDYMVMRKLISECPRCQKKYKKMMGQKTKKNKKYQGGDTEDDDDDEMSDNLNTDIVLNGGSDEVETNLTKMATENNTPNQVLSKDFMAATKGGDEAATTTTTETAEPAITDTSTPIDASSPSTMPQLSTPPPPPSKPAPPPPTPAEAAAAAAQSGGKKRKSQKKKKSMKRK